MRLIPNVRLSIIGFCPVTSQWTATEENEYWMERKYLNMETEGNLQYFEGGNDLIPSSLPITDSVLSL